MSEARASEAEAAAVRIQDHPSRGAIGEPPMNVIDDELGALAAHASRFVRRFAPNALPDFQPVFDEAATATAQERPDVARRLRALCYRHDLPEVLALDQRPLLYDYRQPLEANLPGPWAPTPQEHRPQPQSHTLLGRPSRFPVGVPACPLTSSAAWIRYLARQGFNVLTYKTVRSREHAVHAWPNWVFLDDPQGPLPLATDTAQYVARGTVDSYPSDQAAFSTANSFGVPSGAPDVWQRDVGDALEVLADGQTLIVSVMGSPEVAQSADELAEDFALTARLAVDAGASTIEMNLSCPNTLDASQAVKPPICVSPALTERIVTATHDAVGADAKLVAKLSYLPAGQLTETLEPIADALAGICGINTIQARVATDDGEDTFPGRAMAGLSGACLRRFTDDFIEVLARLRRERGWKFDIVATGGVMTEGDVIDLLAAGADAVQTATAASHDPDLARRAAAGATA